MTIVPSTKMPFWWTGAGKTGVPSTQMPFWWTGAGKAWCYPRKCPFGGWELEKWGAIHESALLVDGSSKNWVLSTKVPLWWTYAQHRLGIRSKGTPVPLSQFRSTSSFLMATSIGIPPPIVNAPIFAKMQNIFHKLTIISEEFRLNSLWLFSLFQQRYGNNLSGF